MKDGFGFCKNQERNGVYFSMVGLPADLAEGDILGDFVFFESNGGPRLINPRRVGNIFERVSVEK